MIDAPQTARSTGASSPPRAVARNAKSLTHHIFDLAELQSQLLAADMSECSRRAIPPLAMIVAGVVVALSGLPLLLLSLVFGLVAAAQWPIWLAMLVSAVAGFTCGALLAWGGWRLLRPRMCILQRSGAELRENLRWLKTALQTRGDVTDVSHG